MTGKEEGMDHQHLLEALDLELDTLSDRVGSEEALGGEPGAALSGHLETCADCRREVEGLREVRRLLSASVVAPREGFAAEVLRSLPPAPWESRAVAVWRWPFALLLALAGVAAILLGGAAAEIEPAAGSLDAFAALARLFQSAALAGAGLLGASWTGLGAGLGEWLGASKGNLAVAGALLVGLNVLFLRLLRPSARRAAVSRKSR